MRSLVLPSTRPNDALRGSMLTPPLVESVGLPLGECLRRLRVSPDQCLMVSGRIWEGTRAVKALASGATAVGLGRAALIAVDEDPEFGLVHE